jgi:hypothetical protein
MTVCGETAWLSSRGLVVDALALSHHYKNVRCVVGPVGACLPRRAHPSTVLEAAGRKHTHDPWEIAVYTIIDRRTTNVDRLPETMERAERDYFPRLRAAPGFTGFRLIADERGDLFVGVTSWEDKSYADAFEATMSDWLQVLQGLGHNGETENRGETVVELQPGP